MLTNLRMHTEVLEEPAKVELCAAAGRSVGLPFAVIAVVGYHPKRPGPGRHQNPKSNFRLSAWILPLFTYLLERESPQSYTPGMEEAFEEIAASIVSLHPSVLCVPHCDG